MEDMQIDDKVIYMGCDDIQVKWGNNTDPKGLLELDKIYEIENIEVHSWHTKIYLIGVDGAFNSVCFDKIEYQ